MTDSDVALMERQFIIDVGNAFLQLRKIPKGDLGSAICHHVTVRVREVRSR